MTMKLPMDGGHGLSQNIVETIDALLVERKQEDPRGSMVITVEGDRFSGKTTILAEIAARHVGPKVRVRPHRDKRIPEGTCLLLGAKAFTQETNNHERYAEFRDVIERARGGYDTDHLLDAAVTTDFLALIEDMLGRETVYVFLDDFEMFDDLSKDLYSQMIGLTSRIDCVIIATSTSAAALSLISATHRVRIDPMSVDSVIAEVEELTGIAPPRAVATQITRMADATRGIVRETALALSTTQLTGASHIPHILQPGPLATAKAEPVVRALTEPVAAALSAISYLDVVTIPCARMIADLTGTTMQDLLSTGCLRVNGGRAEICSGVVQRVLGLNMPQIDASDARWRQMHGVPDPGTLSGTESVHVALHFAGSSHINTADVVSFATVSSAQGGADSARLLLGHAWNALTSPDGEALADTELHIALEDARFTDVLEMTDAVLRDLPPGETRLRTITARLDAAHALYEHSSFASTIEEYQRHRSDHPESSLRHLVDSAERSFDLGLRHEGLQLLAEAGDLLDAASPAVAAEFEFLRAWQIERTSPEQLSEMIGTWWPANHRGSGSVPTRLLQVLAAADPTVARHLSRESSIRPVSRSRRMSSLLVGAEADLDDGLVDSAVRQLDALDGLVHPSAFRPLRRAIARMTVSVVRSMSRGRPETDLDDVTELREMLEHLRGDSPALAARGWMVAACRHALVGQEDIATDAIANSWRASRTMADPGAGDALLHVVLPLVRALRTIRRTRADLPPRLDQTLRKAITELDPSIVADDLPSAVRALADSRSLTRKEKLMLRVLTQETPPDTGRVVSLDVVRSSAPTAPAGKGLAALTSREQEVALRAINGERNREIGAQMFLSLRTVEATLTQIYRKLNVRSKVELAVALHERHRPRPEDPALTSLG